MEDVTAEGHPLVREIDNRGQIITLLQAPNQNESNIPDLVAAIQSIRLICWALINETFLGQLSDESLERLFEAILACPTLDILRCSDLKDRSFRALCNSLMQHPQEIKRLTNVWVVGLTLSEEATFSRIVSFVESLSQIKSLDKVNFLMLAPEEGTSVQSSVTAEFRCSGFAAQSVFWTFGLYDEQISFIRDVFRCNKGRFSHLKVMGADSSGAATQTLGILLLTESTNSSLDKMHLSFDLMHDDGSTPIANALERNSSLKELSLLISEKHSMSCRIEPLAEMLRTNATLEWLEISRSLLNDPSAELFANALNDNRTLKVFDVNFNAPGKVRITSAGFKALLEMLQVNQTLEIIPTHGLDNETLQSKIEWYLNLNESGLRRVQLSGNTSQQEFYSILSEQEELDYLFYLLSQNTSLFIAFGRRQ